MGLLKLSVINSIVTRNDNAINRIFNLIFLLCNYFIICFLKIKNLFVERETSNEVLYLVEIWIWKKYLLQFFIFDLI